MREVIIDSCVRSVLDLNSNFESDRVDNRKACGMFALINKIRNLNGCLIVMILWCLIIKNNWIGMYLLKCLDYNIFPKLYITRFLLR